MNAVSEVSPSDKGAVLMPLLCAGDYVLATKYSDGDPHDQWCVGFYHSTLDYGEGSERYQVIDGEGKQFRGNGFRRIKKISRERGEFILKNTQNIQSGSRSLWWWARAKIGT